jgi:hypothetical protein
MAKAPLEIKSLARKYTTQAIETLVHVMREPTAPPSARVTAAEALLNRGWGKAEATVNVNDKRDSTDWSRDELVAFLLNRGNGGTGTMEAAKRPTELN